MNKKLLIFVSSFIFFFVLLSNSHPVHAEEIEEQSDDVILLDDNHYYDYFFVPGTYQNNRDGLADAFVRFHVPFTYYPDDLQLTSGSFTIRYKDGSNVNFSSGSYFKDIDWSNVNFIFLSPNRSFTLSGSYVDSSDYSYLFFAIIFILGGAIICRSFN